MVFGIDDALLLAGASSLIGGMMGNGDPQQMPTSVSGFETLPEPVKRAYLEQYLPGVLNQFNNGPNPGPLARARTGRYDSQGLKELQAYSDNLSRMRGNAQGMQAQNSAQMQAPIQNDFLNNPLADREREIQLRQMYQKLNPPYARSPLAGDPAHNLGDPTYDVWLNRPNDVFNSGANYQKFRSAILGGSSQGMQNGQQQGGAGVDSLTGNTGLGARPFAEAFAGDMAGANGVRPIPGIEPFNAMQERAFDEIQQYQPRSVESYVNPYSQGGLQALQGMAAYNPMERDVESYMKPYYENVIQRGFSRIGEQLRGDRRDILGKYARMGGIMGPENSTFNDQISLREAEALKNAQDFAANQDIANFSQAQNQRNMEINRRAGLLGNLISGGNETYKIAGGLQAVGNDQRMQGLDALLAAGNQVQAQGQNEINAVNPLIQQQLPQNRLDMLGSRLGNFQGTSQSFSYMPGEQNMFSKIGNAGIGFAGLHQGYHDMRGTPWLGALGGRTGIGGLAGGRIGSIGGYV